MDDGGSSIDDEKTTTNNANEWKGIPNTKDRN